MQDNVEVVLGATSKIHEQANPLGSKRCAAIEKFKPGIDKATRLLDKRQATEGAGS